MKLDYNVSYNLITGLPIGRAITRIKFFKKIMYKSKHWLFYQ